MRRLRAEIPDACEYTGVAEAAMRMKTERLELLSFQTYRRDETECRSAAGIDVVVDSVAKWMCCQLKKVEGRKVDVGLGSGSERLGWALAGKRPKKPGKPEEHIFRALLNQKTYAR